MSKKMKSVLLSALIIPGLGHFYLRRHRSGLVLCCTALICLGFVIYSTVKVSATLTEQLASGQIGLDLAELTATASQTSAAGSFSWAGTIFFICWLVAIVDLMRLPSD